MCCGLANGEQGLQTLPFLAFRSAVKEDPEVADKNLDNELDTEQLQDKVKTQGTLKVEDEEQDLKVCW